MVEEVPVRHGLPVRHRPPAALSFAAAPLAAAALVVVVGQGVTSTAAPADTTTLSFEVVGAMSGDLHIAVAPDGGLVLPLGGGATDAVLADAAVIDSRGGGSRDWAASVAATGLDDAVTLSYKVVAPTDPGTGTVTNRMPDWTTVRGPRDAVVVGAISRPSAAWSWTPHLRVDRAVGGVGSIGPTSAIRSALVTSAL
ncbi:hypothetical protein ABIE38_002667 [Dietzia sp. 2505]|uniref:hypothetical protein n=1 Tax=Dietzia sp. 2505 TaxID=3156457 RepID=UPI0033966EE5